jgi:hypothetical protein
VEDLEDEQILCRLIHVTFVWFLNSKKSKILCPTCIKLERCKLNLSTNLKAYKKHLYSFNFTLDHKSLI